MEYVKNIHQNLGKIDRNSTITIHGKEIKMLKIHLPDWKQNEEAYRINLEDLVTTVTQKGLALLDKNENLEEMTGVISTQTIYMIRSSVPEMLRFSFTRLKSRKNTRSAGLMLRKIRVEKVSCRHLSF